MSASRKESPNEPTWRGRLDLTDSLGVALAVVGIILVWTGIVLEDSQVSFGAAVRTLGGLLCMGGLALVMFGQSRRRAAALRASRRVVAWYLSRTAGWAWPDRAGVAAVAMGFILDIPALALQIMFKIGWVVAAPGLIVFWIGAGLLIYGRFYKRRAERGGAASSSPSRGG